MSTQIITVNEKEITIATFGSQKYVAIKPICEAIGVDYDNQIEKIKSDEILSQLTTLRGGSCPRRQRTKNASYSTSFCFWLAFYDKCKKSKTRNKRRFNQV